MSNLISREPNPDGERVQILGVFKARALNAVELGLDASPVEVCLRFHNEDRRAYSVSISYPRRVQIGKKTADRYDRNWGFASLHEAESFFEEIHALGLEEWSKRYLAETAEASELSEEHDDGSFRLDRNEPPEPRKIQRWVYQNPKPQPETESVLPPPAKPRPAPPARTPHVFGPPQPLEPDAGISFFSFDN